MRAYFNEIADEAQRHLLGDEIFTGHFQGEDSDFVRFNRSEVRQAGSVVQLSITIDLIEGRRHAAGTLTLSGVIAEDRSRLSRLIRDLREQRSHVPEDPHLHYSTEGGSSGSEAENRLPDRADAVAEVRRAGSGRDLVGVYAGGGIHAGFASSFGRRDWYASHSFNLDWSFYHERDKAVKASYAGFSWEKAAFDRVLHRSLDQLSALRRPPKTIAPGRYRVYLSPAALNDFVGVLGWGGFGMKAHRTKQTPLLKLAAGEARLHPSLTIVENTAHGIAPGFQQAGFRRPDHVTLIEKGAFRDCLVSPRSAKEYGVPTNGAEAEEAPLSVDVAAGTLPMEQVLRKLGTGILINNVWYLNYSDRTACRTTGMTRFATFWVENGAIHSPLNVMRFDETAYRMLGENLTAMTTEREMILDPQTYFARSVRSSRMPGALIEDFTLTL